MDLVTAVTWAPFLALGGALINGLLGRALKRGGVAGVAGTTAAALAFLLALISFISLAGSSDQSIRVVLWNFLSAGDFQLPLAFMIDQLSSLMALIITGVGLLIHIYSLGYMQDDPGLPRYYAGLNLFLTAMLLLVLADSFILMFIGWEGVGVCSFLLIGFWYGERLNANAARKAFIMNRIGDVGFLLAMFMTYRTFGTLEIAAVNQAAGGLVYGSAALTLIGLLYLLAATGKSAQLPLQVWLPDAMAGPTPVSALIHAATMVTAGVYLVARTAPLFAQAPAASATVAWVGALTALIAAFSALAQKDIKKILAYSTISQLGFMFVAVGAGAYWVGVFHLFTHAFFKALLFLASGSVIHALNGEQDIDRMGGLGRVMRITGITALIGTLAISGVPFLSGFFSKDAITLYTLRSEMLLDYGGPVLYAILLLTSILTAFYMFRWYWRVFGGQSRLSARALAAVHESPAVMTVPLVVLAVLSVLAGYLGLPEFIGPNWFANWLAAPTASAATFLNFSVAAEWLLLLVAVLATAVGLGLGYWIYVLRGGGPAARGRESPPGRASRDGLGFDTLYDWIAIRPATETATGLGVLDRDVIDRGITGSGRGIGMVGRALVWLQSGFVRIYALGMLAGLVVLAVIIVVFSGVLA
jgi:NADH-quinone oxidoreductase subunit L